MRTHDRYSLAIIGAIIGVVGFVPFWWATSMISAGNRYMGMGWDDSSISQSAAALIQACGIAVMLLGTIILVIGLVAAFREKQG